MMVDQLHLNNPDGRDSYARHYQRTLFDWDAAEVLKVPETTEKTLERGKILFNIKAIVSNLKFLKVVLNLERTFWVGMKFCVANGEMAHYMQRILPKHVIAVEIGSTTAGLKIPLGTIADSP